MRPGGHSISLQTDMRGDLPPSVLQPKGKDYVMTLSSRKMVIFAGGFGGPCERSILPSPSNGIVTPRATRIRSRRWWRQARRSIVMPGKVSSRRSRRSSR